MVVKVLVGGGSSASSSGISTPSSKRISFSELPEQTRMTTLQREILRFVIIIGAFAIAVAILIVNCLVSNVTQEIISYRFRRSFPGTIDVPTLLVDVVSVMGLLYSLSRTFTITEPHL